MTSYRSGMLYKGNIVKNINGKKVIEKENIDLMYDETNDSFYNLLESFNDQLDIAFSNLTEEEKETLNKKIEKHKYSYSPNEVGKPYVDETSIIIISNKKR